MPNTGIEITAAEVQPSMVRSMAHSTEPRARIEPTERSMPPVRITSVMPTATIPLLETWRRTLERLPGLRKMFTPREFTGEDSTPTSSRRAKPQ